MKKNSNDIDSVLIEKVKNGNEGAFNFLVNKYYPRVYASLFSFTKSKEDSEDLAQQTFLKVWQQIKTFRGDSAFFTWVYRIAINLAKLGKQNGVDGVVCSIGDISGIKASLGGDFLSVTPGVRMSQNNDDQKRSGSIYDAIQFGTDFVVVGREITEAKNPEEVLKKIESLIV